MPKATGPKAAGWPPDPYRRQRKKARHPRAKHEDAVARGPTSKQAKPARTAALAKPAPKPKPPSARLDAAEDALAAIKSDYHDQMKALADREAALARERRTLEKRQREDVGTAEATVDDERRAYDTAMQQ